jgi:YD repeat-containing protein
VKLLLPSLVLVTILLCSAKPAFSQDSPDIAAGTYPSATYFGNGYESVDMSTDELRLSIPLLADHSQRGDLNFSYSLSLTGWGAWYTYCDYPYYCEWEPGNTGSGVGPGPMPAMEGALLGGVGSYSDFGTAVDGDGSVHTLMLPSSSASYLESNDGSGIQAPNTCPSSLSATYCIANRKGTYFVNNVAGTGGASIVDRNGNEMTLSPSGAIFGTDQYYSDPQFGPSNSWTMTDTLGRSWTFAQAANTSNCPAAVSATSANVWTTPGLSGGTRQFTFCYSGVSVDTSLPSTGITTYQFSSYYSALSAVVLPDNTNWQFQYGDHYGDITEIILPTGGVIRYAYNPSMGDNCGDGAYVAGVTSRAVSADGTHFQTWQYNPKLGYFLTEIDPLGNNTGVYSFCGEVVEIDSYTGSPSSGVLLKKVTKSYVSYGGTCVSYNVTSQGYLPTGETTTLSNGQSVQTAQVYDANSPMSFTCDDGVGIGNFIGYYGFVTQQSQSDYYTSGTPPLLSITNNTYYALSNPTSSYMSPANLLDLVTSKKVYDGTGNNLCSETDYLYDGSTGDDYSGIGPSDNHGSPPSVRGNLTSITHQLFTSGSTPGSPCTSSPSKTAVTTVQNIYDTGMFHYSTDPLGHNPETDTYSSTYYGAYPTQVCNALGQCTTYTYDFNSGLMLTMTDPNTQETSYSYDCMLRPTEIVHPDSSEETLTYIYGGSNGCGSGNPYSGAEHSLIVNSSITSTNTTNFDALGRTVQTYSSVPASTCSGGYAYVDTTYDPNGRVSTVSNPDCTSTSSDDVNTTYSYDALNRPTAVTEQDGSVVGTVYFGNCTTAADEVGKARKFCNDGAGRMTGVWEDPFGLDYETDYTYDPLGDVLQVQQKGGASSSYWRTRTFGYDSLSRLLCTGNPEVYPASCPSSSTSSTTGAIQYAYDGDDNVTSRTAPEENQTTEAMTVTTSYTYDAGNRLTQKSYNDGTTPTVSYTYDTSSLSCPASGTAANKGQRTGMSDGAGSEVWTYCYLSADSYLPTGGTGVSDQRTTNSVTNTTGYFYNPGGTLAAVTYPSGRTITYTINDALQPTSAEDTANSIEYATSALYTPFGALSSLTNGSGSTILTSMYYNSRMQACRIAVNSSGTAPGSCVDSNRGNVMDLNYNLNAGIADNGNVTAIANNIDGTRSQTFSYDSLNRLATAAASTYTGSSIHCWGESYSYDAWGNLLGIGAISSAYTGCYQPAPSLTVGTNNQITLSGVGYDAAGNLNQGSATGPYFTYNAEGQLTQAASLGTASYLYDGDGRRVEKTASGSAFELYWYDTSSNVLAETDGSGNLLNEYIFFGGRRIARRKVQ